MTARIQDNVPRRRTTGPTLCGAGGFATRRCSKPVPDRRPRRRTRHPSTLK